MNKDNKRISSLLICAGLAAMTVWAFIFIYFVPFANKGDLNIIQILFTELSGIPIFAALVFYVIICKRIGDNNSFCRDNVRDMGTISKLLLLSSAFMAVLAAVTAVRSLDTMVFLFLTGAVAVTALSVLCWGISRLLLHAIEIKEENDMTV